MIILHIGFWDVLIYIIEQYPYFGRHLDEHTANELSQFCVRFLL
jgi:hypothetical protein